MLGVIIVDHMNDVVFYYGDDGFDAHVQEMAVKQGFDVADVHQMRQCTADWRNLLVQLFAPLLASQRFFSASFDDKFESISCLDDTEIAFHELLRYQCMCVVSRGECVSARHLAAVVVTLASMLCGPLLTRLLNDEPVSSTNLSTLNLATLLSRLVATYVARQRDSVTWQLHALRRCNMSAHVQYALVTALQKLAVGLAGDHDAVHLVLTVDERVAACCSGGASTGGGDLAACDLLLLLLLSEALPGQAPRASGNHDESVVECVVECVCFLSVSSSPHPPSSGQFCHYYNLATNGAVRVAPYLLSVYHLATGVRLIAAKSLGGTGLVFHVMHCLSALACVLSGVDQSGADCQSRDSHVTATLKHHMPALLASGNTVSSSPQMRQCLARLRHLWTQPRTGGVCDVLFAGLLERMLCVMMEHLCCHLLSGTEDSSSAGCHKGALPSAVLACAHRCHELNIGCCEQTASLCASLQLHASDNIAADTLPECPLEGASSVLFVVVDRSDNVILSPAVSSTHSSMSTSLHSAQVHGMLEVVSEYLHEGYLDVTWCDQHYTYDHLVWFEDAMGCVVTSKVNSKLLKKTMTATSGAVLMPHYFSKLTQLCFPDSPPDGVRCCQLFHVLHGHVSLQHARHLTQHLIAQLRQVSPCPPASFI